MPIEHILGLGHISGFNDQPDQQQPDKHSQDEEFVLVYLKESCGLGKTQALSVLAAMISSGLDIGGLAFDLQSGNQGAVATVDTFIV